MMENPATRLQKREKELREKISVHSLIKGTSRSICLFIRPHIQRGYQSSSLILLLTTIGAKKSPEKKRAAASRKRIPSISPHISA
jgi:hypothetical protein